MKQQDTSSFFLLSSTSLILIAFFCHLESFQELIKDRSQVVKQGVIEKYLPNEPTCGVKEHTSQAVDSYFNTKANKQTVAFISDALKLSDPNCRLYPREVVVKKNVTYLESERLEETVKKVRILQNILSPYRVHLFMQIKDEVAS